MKRENKITSTELSYITSPKSYLTISDELIEHNFNKLVDSIKKICLQEDISSVNKIEGINKILIAGLKDLTLNTLNHERN